MKKIFTILMLIPILLFGQYDITKNIDLTKNSFYIETQLGFFPQLVLNYERQISSNKKVNWYGRIGGGYGANLTDFFNGPEGFGGLCAITMTTGKKNKHFEFNAGAFLGYEPTLQSAIVRRDITYEPFLLPILNIGYRYQKPGSGFVFRANVGFPSIGVSFGYAF